MPLSALFFRRSSEPQTIETGCDIRDGRAGRDRDREVAVEARVRRSQRPREPVVRALGHEVAGGLVEHGVGDDDHERGVGPVLFEGLGTRD